MGKRWKSYDNLSVRQKYNRRKANEPYLTSSIIIPDPADVNMVTDSEDSLNNSSSSNDHYESDVHGMENEEDNDAESDVCFDAENGNCSKENLVLGSDRDIQECIKQWMLNEPNVPKAAVDRVLKILKLRFPCN